MGGRHFKVSQALLTYPQCTRTKEALLEYLKGRGDILCAVVCHENHHETEGEHLHAWVKLEKIRDLGATQWGSFFDWDGIHGHYDKVKCTSKSIADTVKYVIKDGDYIDWNCNVDTIINPNKSHARKYDNMRILNTPISELVRDGTIPIEKVDAIKRGIAAYKLLDKPADKKATRGIWLYGPAGCGKSTWAKKLGLHLGGYYEKAQNKWWDGYEGEKVVVLDDLDTGTLLHYLKKWTDKFACKGEVKGSTVWLHHDWFVVTSNFTIHEIVDMADKSDHMYEAVKRRFHFLTLPPDQDYFQFDPEADWSNPDEVEPQSSGASGECTEQPPAEVEPPAQKQAPPADDDPLTSFMSGSGF